MTTDAAVSGTDWANAAHELRVTVKRQRGEIKRLRKVLEAIIEAADCRGCPPTDGVEPHALAAVTGLAADALARTAP